MGQTVGAKTLLFDFAGAPRLCAPMLKSLRLTSSCDVPHESMPAVGRFLQWVCSGLPHTYLTTLRINLLPHGCSTVETERQLMWPIGEECLMELAVECKMLEWLDLWNFSITNKHLIGLADSGRLKELSLRNCSGLQGARAICDVVERCQVDEEGLLNG